MSTLILCPACARHVRPGACPFCGADASGVSPLPARPVGRRAFTRAAIAAGAAVLAACGGGEIVYDDGDDETGGGDDGYSSDRDTGRGRDAHVREDPEEARRQQERQRLAAEQAERDAAAAERERLAAEQAQRQQEAQRRQEQDPRPCTPADMLGVEEGGGDGTPCLTEQERQRYEWINQRTRNLPACVHEGTCPAPPYGAPPAEDPLV